MRVSRVLRTFVVLSAAALLMAPGLLMAVAWTTINLEVALAATAVCIFVKIWLPRWKWMSAVVASLLIAIPPYPNWLWADEKHDGWYFHVGYKFQHLDLGGFATIFTVSMLLFAVIFWGTGKRQAR